ncbi:MAG TPA: hypothetical protein VMT87_04130 [Vicinamibacteria bacterium]|nr:hypothetical protein [Vicinamibacteria bacterium]
MNVMRRVPSFIVIGGGELGAGHVRQLLRAAAAARLDTDRIRVVDRDPGCAATRGRDPRVQVENAEWGAWLDAHLAASGADDHLVPHHWAPHLLYDWLSEQARQAGLRVRRGARLPPRGLPFEGDTSAGDRALSYAAWMCPPLCIEPALCPHTRGPRDWSLAGDLETEGEAGAGHIVLRCLHLVYGVGTIPVADILAARDRLIAGAALGRRHWLVATSSHCHALAASLEVAPA